jgi:hypothetical protein
MFCLNLTGRQKVQPNFMLLDEHSPVTEKVQHLNDYLAGSAGLMMQKTINRMQKRARKAWKH